MLSDPRQISYKSSQAASFQGFPPSLVLTLSQVLFQFNLHFSKLLASASTSFNVFQYLSTSFKLAWYHFKSFNRERDTGAEPDTCAADY
jgi:hypothetical protein